TKEMAARYARSGLTVNTVTYGGVEGRVTETFKQRYAELCPQGKMLGLDDLSGPVLFLLSEGSGSVTGHNLMADGGWTLW
ncbi:MAG: SDR family oxidoreductase, partial [Burkholderiales bacterium]